jgi:hypothetical protein
MILGVLPISIVGGFYAVIGSVFGIVSVLVSIYHRAWSSSLWWFGVLGLALGGLIGITGLWLLVLVSERGGTRRLRDAALAASAIGIGTSFVTLSMASRDNRALPWTTIYLLISPIVVACHRWYRLFRRSGRLSVYS